MRRSLAALALALVLPVPVLAGQVTVKPGETLSEIADRFGISTSRLMQINGITNPDHVEVGQRLLVPGSAKGGRDSSQAKRTGASVTVQEGETLSEIADRHGMSVTQLIQLNGLSDPNHVEAGSQLRVAARAAAGSPSGASGYARGASEHVVRPGESLSRISSGYDVPISRLVALNQITDPNHVEAGTRLKLKGTIPAPKAAAAKPAPVAAAVVSQPAPKPQPRPVAATVAPAVATATPVRSSAPAATPVSSAPATTIKPTPRPAAVATASPTPASASTAGARSDWRTYGPLQVDWSNWQPMGGSLVAPTINAKGVSLYLAINCTAQKLNATSQSGQWKTWEDPQADFERQLVGDLCKRKGT